MTNQCKNLHRYDSCKAKKPSKLLYICNWLTNYSHQIKIATQFVAKMAVKRVISSSSGDDKTSYRSLGIPTHMMPISTSAVIIILQSATNYMAELGRGNYHWKPHNSHARRVYLHRLKRNFSFAALPF